MSFLKSWFADRPPVASPEASGPPEVSVAPESIPIDLAAFLEALRAAMGELDDAAIDADVVRAKLADICRSFGIEPLDPLELDSFTTSFDRGGWERMALLVLAAERGGLGEGLKRALSGRVRSAVRGGFVEASRSSPLLTLELLRTAPLRLEELARRFVLGLGASVAGEELENTKRALERLDYGRLLAEADRAKRAAAERSGR
jgi:hypothetical protein